MDQELEAWRQRVAFLRSLDGAESTWPDMSDAGLLASLETWLSPYLHNVSRRDHLRRIDLGAALKAMLPWEQQKALDAEAPTHVTVPSGSRLAIDYGADGGPALAVKLQEMFGAETTPTVARGRVPLLLRLLSPAQRPIQVTRDLAGFWRTSYTEVRKDMRGQYPKHNWPEDPLGAATHRAHDQATLGAKPTKQAAACPLPLGGGGLLSGSKIFLLLILINKVRRVGNYYDKR